MNLFQFQQHEHELAREEFWALEEISFIINKGETIGFYGPNGSGKSTILKLVSDITYPANGSIKVNGLVAPLLEVGAGFHHELTGKENIFVNGAILGMTIPEIKKKMKPIIRFSEIEEFINMPVKKYSPGMYIRLSFSIAIHSEADIYLFDEMIAAGDEKFQIKCIQKIKELKASGKTILMVSHDYRLLEQMVDKIYFLEKGKIADKKNISS